VFLLLLQENIYIYIYLACQIPVGPGAKEAGKENPFGEFFSTAEKTHGERVAFLSCLGTAFDFLFFFFFSL
jgi:hypothetical protein